MNLTQLPCGERAIVTAVECAAPLKERLRSLNIHAGGVVRLIKISFFKKTYLVQAGGSQVALRKEVAQCVAVRRP